MLSPGDYDAVCSTLDGVVTRTAIVHAALWPVPESYFGSPV